MGSEQAGEQRDDIGADDNDTTARHELRYPQLVEVTQKVTNGGLIILFHKLFRCKNKSCTLSQSKFA